MREKRLWTNFDIKRKVKQIATFDIEGCDCCAGGAHGCTGVRSAAPTPFRTRLLTRVPRLRQRPQRSLTLWPAASRWLRWLLRCRRQRSRRASARRCWFARARQRPQRMRRAKQTRQHSAKEFPLKKKSFRLEIDGYVDSPQRLQMLPIPDGIRIAIRLPTQMLLNVFV